MAVNLKGTQNLHLKRLGSWLTEGNDETKNEQFQQ